MTFLVDIFHTGINGFSLTCIIMTPVKIEQSSRFQWNVTIFYLFGYHYTHRIGTIPGFDVWFIWRFGVDVLILSPFLQDVVLEYIKQPELKYLRALGCAYLRITARRGETVVMQTFREVSRFYQSWYMIIHIYIYIYDCTYIYIYMYIYIHIS